MRVASNHFFATVSDPLLDYFCCRASHDQGAYSVMSEAVHTATFQPELAKQRVKMLIENSGVHERCLPSRLEDQTLRFYRSNEPSAFP